MIDMPGNVVYSMYVGIQIIDIQLTIYSCYKTEFILKYGKLIHKTFQKVSKQQKNIRLTFISKL